MRSLSARRDVLSASELVDDALTTDEFKSAFRNHPAGVAVITADTGGGPVGLTATSVFSVSVEPPLLVFSVSDMSSSTPAIKAAETVVVHLIGENALDIARLCATHGVDRFGDPTKWDRLPTGEPYFTGADTWIRGRIVNTLAAGTATLVVVQGLQSSAPPAGSSLADAEETRPIVYHNRAWHVIGDHSQLPEG